MFCWNSDVGGGTNVSVFLIVAKTDRTEKRSYGLVVVITGFSKQRPFPKGVSITKDKLVNG